MKIYISTPINGRPEESMVDKVKAAKYRIEVLTKHIKSELPEYPDTEIVSTFDYNTSIISEAEAMGNCIRTILESDAVYMDNGWEISRGCRLEKMAANIYGIKVYYHDGNG